MSRNESQPATRRARISRALETQYAERVSRVLDLLKGSWTIHVLCAMRKHPVRLSELQRMIPSASKKAITASLRSLQAMQVINRTDFSDAILHVEYENTGPMQDQIESLLDYLADWSSSLPEVENSSDR